MTHKIVQLVGTCIGILLILEVLGLLLIKFSIGGYANYWHRTANTPGTFTYVALGDSAAQGIGATRVQDAYVNRIAATVHATTGKTLRIVNLSVSGAKVQDVINKQLPQLQNYHPDMVTLDIGANDIGAFNESRFRSQFNDLAAQLPPGSFVATISYFGGRIKSPVIAPLASRIIAESVSAHGLRLVNLQAETQNRQSALNYSFDYFHPSNKGHQIWSEAFMKAIAPTL